MAVIESEKRNRENEIDCTSLEYKLSWREKNRLRVGKGGG